MSTPSESKATARPTNTSASSRLSTNNTPMGDFHNPYNFVPALPRNNLPKFEAKKLDRELISELGDGSPVGHGAYYDGYWSGKISVTLTTVTPLLIPDAAKATGDDHKTYPIRVGLDGKPYLPSTSIKGMLRSAYEAVTNSRLSVFAKHEDRLAYRMLTQIGLEMIPARIEDDGSGGKSIRFFPGTSTISNNGTPSPNLMYAAWLPRYLRGQISRNAVRYPNGELPEHKQEVEVWIEKFQHYRWDKNQNKHIPDFQYWRVCQITLKGEILGSKPQFTSEPSKQNSRSHHQSLRQIEQVHGFVCITNPNIDKKHDERLFFDGGSQEISTPLTEQLEKQWKNLIFDYQNNHEDEICKKHQNSPPALTNSVWSRHIKGAGYALATQERELNHGTLCYARVRKNNGNYEVLGLYPVIIARELFNVSPLSLLPEQLRPATDIKFLSPADRVFGWVNQNGQGSYKGQIRIHSVKCDSDDAIEPFEEGLPLAILGEPKPQQSRFYVAQNSDGEPLPNGTKKAEGYQEGQGLRGRKVYPHHQLPGDYWETDSGTIEVGDQYREYLRPDQTQDNQNRTIKAWVKPETKFSFDIEVINLSSVELGALLWSLSLPDDCYHRLGGGKPLGFGSIQLKIADTDLRKGEQWREFYSSLIPIAKPEQTTAINRTEDFQKVVEDAYNNNFLKVSFISAFVQSAKGFNKPIHYPRISPEPQSEGKSYEWFVANENDTRDEKALRLSLPELAKDLGLPLSPRIPKSN